MLRGLYSAASGMNYQIQQVDLIANNLANVGTNGYKRKELLAASFGDVLIQLTEQAKGAEASVGTGVRVDGVARFETPGNLVATGNRFNLAITGPGYFVTRGADGVDKLTRDGDFQIDARSRLVTRNGEEVLDTARQPITLTGDLHGMRVADDGNINLGDTPVAQILVVNPPPEQLETRFPIAERTLPRFGNAVMKQGFLEQSNVNVVTEMVSMLTANRAYGFGQKVISAHDQMLQKAANDLGRIT